MLHGGTRITVWKGINPIGEAVEKEKANRATNLQADGLRRVLLYPDEIASRASIYRTDGQMPMVPKMKKEEGDLSAANELEKLSIQCMHSSGVNATVREHMLYRKMAADLEMGRYEEAYEDAQRIYVQYASDLHYQKMLRIILHTLGYEQEAAMEEARADKRHYRFLIAPYMGLAYSNYCMGLVELGNILYHMGHQVTYLFDTNDTGEIWYIRNNQDYVSRREGKKGGRQLLVQDLVQEYGSLQNYLRQIASEKVARTVLVNRSPACLAAAQGVGSMITVFPDFSDDRCMESVYGRKHMNNTELMFLYTESDIVFSHQYHGENAHDWQDKGEFDLIEWKWN